MNDKRYVKVPVKTVRVHLFCTAEGCDGEMKFNGSVLMSNPPKYQHECPKCGMISNERQKYPAIEYVEE